MSGNVRTLSVSYTHISAPMVSMVTTYTGGLSELLMVEVSWEKNSKKKSSVHNICNSRVVSVTEI